MYTHSIPIYTTGNPKFLVLRGWENPSAYNGITDSRARVGRLTGGREEAFAAVSLQFMRSEAEVGG